MQQLPAETLVPHVLALPAKFEADLLPKPIWKPAKMAEDVMDPVLRMILLVRMNITSVDGPWKLDQNKTRKARQWAIAGLMALDGASAEIAEAMGQLSGE